MVFESANSADGTRCGDGHPPHREVRRTQRLPAVEESSIIRSNESLSSTDETRMAGV